MYYNLLYLSQYTFVFDKFRKFTKMQMTLMEKISNRDIKSPGFSKFPFFRNLQFQTIENFTI